MEAKPIYKRVILKLSGEALAGKPLPGERRFGLDFDVLNRICLSLKKCVDAGVQVGVVVGGGNFWRGVKDGNGKLDRIRADHMGMMGTVMNSLAVADVLDQNNVPVRVQTAIEIRAVAEPYIRAKAIRHFEKGRVVVFACGVGRPYFSTDTAAALCAAELRADVILFGKNGADGVYDSDPNENPSAVKFDEITYSDILSFQIGVMDSTATTISMDNHIPLIVFTLEDPDNIYRVVMGEKLGSRVK